MGDKFVASDRSTMLYRATVLRSRMQRWNYRYFLQKQAAPISVIVVSHAWWA